MIVSQCLLLQVLNLVPHFGELVGELLDLRQLVGDDRHLVGHHDDALEFCDWIDGEGREGRNGDKDHNKG